MKRFMVFAVAVAALLALGSFALKNLDAPASPKSRAVSVEIKPGMRLAEVAETLANAGVIRSADAFSLLARIYGFADRIKAGEYDIDPSKTPREILGKLAEGRMKLHALTVPEGFTLFQIARLAEERGFCAAKDFLTAAADPALLAEFGVKGKNAEGYLMPETYHFRKNAGAPAVVRKMLATFAQKTAPLREKYAADADMDFADAVTLASIVEKEAAGPEEFRTISAVFHNRLRRGMPLQADPTVIYAIEGFDGNIRKKDLGVDSPYNTYRHKGLPPGPIANPGLGALEAVYAPEDAAYLYFVAMGDQKRHHFSSTLKEHNDAVRKYQLRGKSGAAAQTGKG